MTRGPRGPYTKKPYTVEELAVVESRGDGKCLCGCGGTPGFATTTNFRKGWVRGFPRTYIRGHQGRQPNGAYTPEEAAFMASRGDGTCRCGCGETPAISKVTHLKKGYVRGFPKPYILGHQTRTRLGKYRKRQVGETKINAAGYRQVFLPEYHQPTLNGWVMEHRLVMEEMLGRELLPEEQVHHRGTLYPVDDIRNRSDNRPENLQLAASLGDHRRLHKGDLTRAGKWARKWDACRECGRVDRPHAARGLCNPCNARRYSSNAQAHHAE